jgi:hypothetical protein
MTGGGDVIARAPGHGPARSLDVTATRIRGVQNASRKRREMICIKAARSASAHGDAVGDDFAHSGLRS